MKENPMYGKKLFNRAFFMVFNRMEGVRNS